ncbi:TrmH family RNA methyltransferase [Candidatus Saccharibacteria bacterium]|nr:TrmH family RNA methyltransferase [Candidatus Saccharibacteria bacterium]
MSSPEIILVLHNIRSTYNVGAIFRTFEGFGGQKVVCSGVTPCGYVTNADDKREVRPEVLPHLAEKLDHQIGKTALGAEKALHVTFSDDILGFLSSEKASGARIVGLENNLTDSRVRPLSDAKKALAGVSRVILVVGEEVSGISSEILPLLDCIFEIPMRGAKESFNVSVATGVALYELMGRE